jgi:peptidoglycan/LPS O-acetylase OafA/YrhL
MRKASKRLKGYTGLYAVNVFFIISGFYMAMILNGKYEDKTSIQFYKSRVFRLFPTYYCSTPDIGFPTATGCGIFGR